MRTALIIGGTGFLGSHLARRLVNDRYNVIVLARRPRPILDVTDKVRIVRGDILNLQDLVEVINNYKPECLFHLAAMLSALSEENPIAGYKVGIEGTWNILEAARIMKIKKVVFASSLAVYGPKIPEYPHEGVHTEPRTIYGISKVFGELLGLYYYWKYGIFFVACRFPSIIGPGRQNGGASAYTSLIIQKPAQGEPYEANVPENARLPIIYIKDAVDVVVKLYMTIEKLKSRVFNLGGIHPSPTAGEIAATVKQFIPEADITFKPDPETAKIVKNWLKDVDDSRLRTELGWQPTYSSLPSLVQDFIQEVRRNPNIFYVK